MKKSSFWIRFPMQTFLAMLAATAIGTAARADGPAVLPANLAVDMTGPSIVGFRHAEFGMTPAEVRATITNDFHIPLGAISEGENALQHTEVLSVRVPDLIPGGGTAAISYVFGYQTHRLIEINIIWSGQVDPKTTPTLLYQNGQNLQQYFATEGFPANRSIGNVATNSGILLFRALDPKGNAVVLALNGTLTKDAKSDKTVLNPAALTLAYASDPAHPDVFSIGKGSF